MLVKTKGIVIKSTRYGENSLIVKMYTESHGLLSFLIQSVFSARSAIKPALLQPMQLLEMEFYFRPNKNLLRQKEIRNLFIHNRIHFEVIRSSIALVIAELIHKCIVEEEANEDMFNFLEKAVLVLDESNENLANFLIVFFLRFSRHLGFEPENNFSNTRTDFHIAEGKFVLPSHHSELHLSLPYSSDLSIMMSLSLHNFYEVVLSKNSRSHILEALVDYYKIHTSSFQGLKTLEVLKNLFSS